MDSTQQTNNGSTALATKAAAATVELAPRSNEIVRVGFDTAQGFEALQRVGKAFCASSLVPESYRGPQNLANTIIAVEMASRMGASPLMVMQNLYIVHGRPAWSSQFLVAAFNSCGRFSSIGYRFTGRKGEDTWGCIAFAKDLGTGEVREGPEVTIAMAKKEGWHGKTGSKWQSIPQLMLTYRAATFFIRTTAPELTMGLRPADEVEDIGSDVPEFTAPPPATPLDPVAAQVAQPSDAIPAGTTVTTAGLAAAGGDPLAAAQEAVRAAAAGEVSSS
jgi:hypothetical protein